MEITTMKKLLLLLFFLFTSNSLAEPCKIKMVDLSETLQSDGNKVITASNLTDIYSNEPIRRYVQIFSDGSIVITEQKHLQLSNTLNKTEVWEKWFKPLNAAEILRNEISSTRFTSQIGKPGSISYSLDDKIFTKNENSEAILRLVNVEPGTLPFEKIISLYIGVGGL
jgi:hypothetical protein